MIDTLFQEGARDDRRLRITPLQREFAAVSLWFLVTFVQFKGDELLLYPLALYFACRAWQERATVLGMMVKSWPIMLLPIWCLISPIWAVEPMEAFKQAIYLLLTMVICYHIALHLSARQILYAILLASGVIGVLTVMNGVSSGDFGRTLFAHKNRMGISMVILWTVSITVLLDARAGRWERSLSTLGVAVSLFLILKSSSATAILLALATISTAAFCAVVLVGSFLRPSRIALLCLVLSLCAGIGSVAVSTLKSDPVDVVLEYFGKDRTLTGRTVLWQYAEDQIEEAPILGVGAGGFWRWHASPHVRRIFEEFYKGPRDVFNFHNSYYEVAVHQGKIGVGLMILAQVWATAWIVVAAVSRGSMPQMFFLCITFAVLVRTFTEADFYKPFVLFHMLFWIGALLALRTHNDDRGDTASEPS